MEQINLSAPIAAAEADRDDAFAALMLAADETDRDDAFAALVATVLAAACFVSAALSSIIGDRLSLVALGGVFAMSSLWGWRIRVSCDEDDPWCIAAAAGLALWLAGWLLFYVIAPANLHPVWIASTWQAAVHGLGNGIDYIVGLVVAAVLVAVEWIALGLCYLFVAALVLNRLLGLHPVILINLILALRGKQSSGVGNTRSAKMRDLRNFDITD